MRFVDNLASSRSQKPNMKKGFVLFFISFLTTFFAVAQTSNKELKATWENTKIPDSTRFSALAKYYILNNQVHPDSTLQVLEYYYKLAREKNNIKELYNVANDRGGIYRLKGDLDKSMHYYEEAQKHAFKLNDLVLKANVTGNIGNVFANKKDYKKALQYFTSAFSMHKKANDKIGETRILSSIGNVYLFIENFDLALDYYQKALATSKNADVAPRSIAVIYLNIGWTTYEKKQYEKSRMYNEKAVEILEKTQDKFFLASGYSNLARVHLERNQLELAYQYAEKCYKLGQELKVSEFDYESRIIFARIDLKKGAINVAKQRAESILKSFDNSASLEFKASVYDVLYKCYKADNNPTKSLEMYQKYTSYKDSIQLEKNKITLLREVIKAEFVDVLTANKLKSEKEKAALESRQEKITSGIIFGAVLIIVFIVLYYNRNLQKNRKKRDELLEELERLKTAENSNLVVNPNEFQLDREKINQTINRKINDTDWNVLTILLSEPDISNKDLAEKAFLSVDGIGSSLRRMYVYFEIKESKYKKISLITEAIKASAN